MKGNFGTDKYYPKPNWVSKQKIYNPVNNIKNLKLVRNRNNKHKIHN